MDAWEIDDACFDGSCQAVDAEAFWDIARRPASQGYRAAAVATTARYHRDPRWVARYRDALWRLEAPSLGLPRRYPQLEAAFLRDGELWACDEEGLAYRVAPSFLMLLGPDPTGYLGYPARYERYQPFSSTAGIRVSGAFDRERGTELWSVLSKSARQEVFHVPSGL